MRIGVFGAGAVGSHVAARLALCGHEVSVLGRGAHLEAVRDRGLVLRSADRDRRAAVQVADHPDELGPQPILFVTVKAPALRGLANRIRPMVDPDGLVVFAQNGIPWWYPVHQPQDTPSPPDLPSFGLREEFLSVMSTGQIVGGIVRASSEVIAPGYVLSNSRSNSLLVGYADDRSDATIVELREALAASGLASPPVQSIRREVWLKLLRNMSSSSISAATGSTTGAVKQDARLAETFRRIVSEMMDVARASGFPLVGLTDPDQMLASTDDVVPSLLQDLRIGRKVEVGDLLEAPLRFARERQVATPTTDAVVAIVRRLAADKGLL